MKKGWLNNDELLLKSLQMERIQISEIEEDSFSSPSFQPLEDLQIVNVPLRTFNKGTFNGLKNLAILNMRGLRLGFIEKNVLAPVPNLRLFHLIGCGPEKIWLDNLFGGAEMPKLTKIRINNCNLNDTITETTFLSIPKIKQLILSNNNIEKIGPKSFDVVLKTLNMLFLMNNKLKTVPENLFQTDNKVLIQLNSNPWHCGCELEHLRLFQQNTKNVNVDSLICQTPKKFRKEYLKNCTTLCDQMTDFMPILESTSNILEKEPLFQQQKIEFSSTKCLASSVESMSMDLFELIPLVDDGLIEFIEFLESANTTESTPLIIVESDDEESEYYNAILIPICFLCIFLIGILVLFALSSKFEIGY